jgi:hypothetical protein
MPALRGLRVRRTGTMDCGSIAQVGGLCAPRIFGWAAAAVAWPAPVHEARCPACLLPTRAAVRARATARAAALTRAQVWAGACGIPGGPRASPRWKGRRDHGCSTSVLRSRAERSRVAQQGRAVRRRPAAGFPPTGRGRGSAARSDSDRGSGLLLPGMCCGLPPPGQRAPSPNIICR